MEEGELDIDTEPPTEEEIKRVEQTLKNGKAPGIDQLAAELLKADRESNCVELKHLCDLIWQEEKLLEQWKQGLICKISKKGNLQQCGNRRGVALLPITSKVLEDSDRQNTRRCGPQAEERVGRVLTRKRCSRADLHPTQHPKTS